MSEVLTKVEVLLRVAEMSGKDEAAFDEMVTSHEALREQVETLRQERDHGISVNAELRAAATASRENASNLAVRAEQAEARVEKLRADLEEIESYFPDTRKLVQAALADDGKGQTLKRCILMVNSAGEAHAVVTYHAPGYVPGLHEVYAWYEAPAPGQT